MVLFKALTSNYTNPCSRIIRKLTLSHRAVWQTKEICKVWQRRISLEWLLDAPTMKEKFRSKEWRSIMGNLTLQGFKTLGGFSCTLLQPEIQPKVQGLISP